MASEEDIKHAQERLRIYRANLAHYLRQQALLGSAYVPPVVVHGIREARQSIKQLKELLRSWNIGVEDHPDEIDGPESSQDRDSSEANTSPRTPAQQLEQFDRARLRQLLTEYFSIEELFDLFFDLNIDHESLPGSGKASKARELIFYAQRHGRYSELVQRVRELRPELKAWHE